MSPELPAINHNDIARYTREYLSDHVAARELKVK